MNCSISDDDIRLIQENKKLEAHYSYIVEWNQRINIMAKSEVQKGYEFYLSNHVYDALYALSALKQWTNRNIIDIGSGGGIPGITLAILLGNIPYSCTLCEATGKKAEFLIHVIQKLDLPFVTVISERAEILGCNPLFREKFDVTTSRAVGYIDECLEYSMPLLKIGGKSLLFRGTITQQDIMLSTAVSNNFGGKLEKIVDYRLKDMQNNRNIMVFDKYKCTPLKYPRGPGIPKKKSVFKGINSIS